MSSSCEVSSPKPSSYLRKGHFGLYWYLTVCWLVPPKEAIYNANWTSIFVFTVHLAAKRIYRLMYWGSVFYHVYIHRRAFLAHYSNVLQAKRVNTCTYIHTYKTHQTDLPPTLYWLLCFRLTAFCKLSKMAGSHSHTSALGFKSLERSELSSTMHS